MHSVQKTTVWCKYTTMSLDGTSTLRSIMSFKELDCRHWVERKNTLLKNQQLPIFFACLSPFCCLMIDISQSVDERLYLYS